MRGGIESGMSPQGQCLMLDPGLEAKRRPAQAIVQRRIIFNRGTHHSLKRAKDRNNINPTATSNVKIFQLHWTGLILRWNNSEVNRDNRCPPGQQILNAPLMPL